MDKKQTDVLSEELEGFAADAVKDIKKNKVIIPIILLALVVVASAFFATSVVPLIAMAKTTGNAIGETAGTVAGIAIGSYEGATKGTISGISEGQNDGLSANDTTATIANVIESNVQSMGKLEVLVANVELTTYHEIGKAYGALYMARGSAVFTVDLSQVKVTYNDGLIQIVLPRPTSEITIDPAETELLAEWQRKFFNGTDSQGFQSYLNSFSAIKNLTSEQVSNYTILVDQAATAARDKVQELANMVNADGNVNVTVSILAE